MIIAAIIENDIKIGTSVTSPRVIAENTHNVHTKESSTLVLNMTTVTNKKNIPMGITDKKPNIYIPNLNSGLKVAFS